MQNILIINNGTSGLFGFRRELLETLCKEHKVTVIAKDTGSVDKLLNLGCKYIPVEMDYHGANPIKEYGLLRFYRCQIKQLKPDIVLTYTIKPNTYGGMACASMGVPYIANITGLGTAVEYGGLMQKITIPLYRFGLRKAQKVFFQNKENMEFMKKHRMVSDNYDLLPGSGVNLERFPLLDYPDSQSVDFVFISRIMKEKGIYQYVDAAKTIREKYPFTRFHVYGSADSQNESAMKELHDAGVIVYHGYTTNVGAVHSMSSCTIHPTYYPEGMSNVLLESCASGRPIITTDRAGCREIVDDGVNGFVVKQKDSQDLIEKIEKFLSLSWEERRAMGLAGRAKVEREFDRNIVIEKYLNEMEKI